MDIKGLNLNNEIYQNKTMVKVAQNENQVKLIFATNPMSSNIIEMAKEPEPTPLELAGEIMKCLRTGNRRALAMAIKSIPSEHVFEVLKLCYAQTNENYIHEQIFNIELTENLAAKIVENISNRDDLPDKYKAYICVDVALLINGASNITGRLEDFSSAMNKLSDYLSHGKDNIIENSIKKLARGEALDFRWNIITDL